MTAPPREFAVYLTCVCWWKHFPSMSLNHSVHSIHSSRQLAEIICCATHPFSGTCIGVSSSFVLYATIPGVQSVLHGLLAYTSIFDSFNLNVKNVKFWHSIIVCFCFTVAEYSCDGLVDSCIQWECSIYSVIHKEISSENITLPLWDLHSYKNWTAVQYNYRWMLVT